VQNKRLALYLPKIIRYSSNFVSNHYS